MWVAAFLSIGVIASVAFAQEAPPNGIPKGTTVSVRTLDAIQSKQVELGQNYRCTLESPLTVAGKDLAAKGADCILKIVEMKAAGAVSGNNELKLVVAEIRMGGNLVPVDTEPAAIAGKGKGKSTAMRTGIGAAAGAGVGAIFGGGKGAAIGAAAGGGAGAASSALTQGPEIKVAPETVLAFVTR